jgi:phospholipid/cholesterol/gamma-HCH transport system substrate-binding protein
VSTGGESDDRGSDAEERARHWEELKRRRAERDARLEEMEKRGELGGKPVSREAEVGASGILEKMREGEGRPQNPVYQREQEAARRSAETKRRARTGLALLACAGVALFAVTMLLGSTPYTVTASFENASQLVNGNEVVMGGTRVGTVDSVELGDEGQALVTFSLDEPYAPLHRGTVATVRSFSLSGIANRQIQLTVPPEGAAGPEIEDGGSLDQSETVSAVDLDHIFNTLDDETVADLKKVIRGFEISYEGVGEQANEGIRYMNPFLSTSRQLFAELTYDERALERLIVDGSQLSGALAERRDDVSSLVTNLNQTMGALARQKTALATSINQLPDFLRNFNTTAVNLRATLDDLDPLVDASKPVAIKLRPFFAEFRGAASNLVPTIRDLDVIVKDPGADNDLVDLTRLQDPLAEIAVGPVQRNGATREGTFPEATTALTDSLTQLSFFRAYTPELVGWFDDFGRSGVTDANGGIGRIGTTFNSFTFAPPTTPGGLPIPIVDIIGGGDFGADTPLEQLATIDTGNTQRCPGSNERPAPDGSNPFTDGGELDCDPDQIPPGP